MKHEIQYKRLINGLMYQSYSEDFKDQILDFYYDVFLKGKIFNQNYSKILKIWIQMSLQLWLLVDTKKGIPRLFSKSMTS